MWWAREALCAELTHLEHQLLLVLLHQLLQPPHRDLQPWLLLLLLRVSRVVELHMVLQCCLDLC